MTCSVFPRRDANIVHDVRQVLDELPLANPKNVIVTVHHGVVTLAGTMRPEADQEQPIIPLALRLIWDIDGVVDVANKLADAKASKPAQTA